MKKILVQASSGAALLALIFGVPANANPFDPYAGQTYAKVQERTNGKARIASRVGEYLPTEDCIVTGSRRLGFKDSSGRGGQTILVDLNCNDPRSVGGDGSDHPGYSVASPEGRKMDALKQRAVGLSKNYASAVAAGKEPACDRYMDSCRKICVQSGACSAELMQYLGM